MSEPQRFSDRTQYEKDHVKWSPEAPALPDTPGTRVAYEEIRIAGKAREGKASTARAIIAAKGRAGGRQ